MKKTFVADVAYSVITPPLGTLLYGYPVKRPASSVHDDLRANVAVFGYEKPEACLINLDLCAIFADRVEYLSEIIEKETGIPKDNVIISTIHTHSGPCITGTPGYNNEDESYINDIFYPGLIKAVKDATKNIAPVKMGIATTKCNVGVNRRQIKKDGSVCLGQRPYGTNDPTMTVMSFKNSETNKPVLNIVHYSCHGTAMGHDTDISRDWIGYLVDAIEEESGATSLYINGSIGDTGPRLSNGKTCGNVELCREIGVIAADCVIKAYRKITEYNDVCFKIANDKVSIPYKELEPLDKIEEELSKLEGKGELSGIDLIIKRSLEARKEIHMSETKPETHMNLKQVIFKFNSVVLVPFPFEIFSEIALRLREYSPAEHTLSISKANGSFSYFPCMGEILHGGYEVDLFFKRNTYVPVNNADDYIINDNLRIIEKLFE